MNKSCENCVFAESCNPAGRWPCGYFLPCDPADEEEFYDDLAASSLEAERDQYYKDWMQYVDEE